jgi:hypothetical protein
MSIFSVAGGFYGLHQKGGILPASRAGQRDGNVADSTDVILQLSDKQWSSAMQARDRMASLANALIVAAAVLQGFVVLDGFETASLAAAAVMIALGVYGAIATRRYTARFRTELERFTKLAARLDELAPDAGLVALEMGPQEASARRFSPVWLVHAGLVLLGAVNLAVAL